MKTEREKRSGAHVLALSQILNLTVDKGKGIEANFNEYTHDCFCLCFHFDSYLQLWEWAEEEGVTENKRKDWNMLLHLCAKGMKAHYPVVSKRWWVCGRSRESLGSCFHGYACQQQRSHLGRDTGQELLCWRGWTAFYPTAHRYGLTVFWRDSSWNACLVSDQYLHGLAWPLDITVKIYNDLQWGHLHM